ncbi:hypothetical protein RclHR1_08870003 [Rhizophagus clarus]|uniref:F-box domain-containing protein n=1 Tax=Rhizophagus clarus TaxID=94130 RepID=A0A2Z6S235_9GLOM|nr:hypothetical protein RclHR1_08870003 [Rhizophagus clarus]GET01560.1 hypothetical protein GLOIN_2v1764011 [Rhizophagus clarus]
MSILNKDILLYISQEFGNNSNPLFSCLLVNKLWFETFVSILWKEPWKFLNGDQERVFLLFNTIILHLSEDSKKLLASQEISRLTSLQQKPLINYISYCNQLDLRFVQTYIHLLTGSSEELDYQRYFIEQEIYKLFMSRCLRLRYLKLEYQFYNHQLHHFPGANTCLSELVQLQCTTNIDSEVFFGLSLICKKIEKFYIISFLNENLGLNRLIQVQQNLNYFRLEIDRFKEKNYKRKDTCKGLGNAIMKHSKNILHFKVTLDCDVDFPPLEFYQNFVNLKTLSLYNNNRVRCFDSRFSLLECPKLEILQIGRVSQFVLSKIISKTEGLLWYIRAGYTYDENQSKDLIRTIYQHCPDLCNVYLIIDDQDFEELKQLLMKCKNLFEIILQSHKRDKLMANGSILLDLLVRYAPINLEEIELVSNWEITVKDLEKFLKNWALRENPLELRIRRVPSITDEHLKILDIYKEKGIIKLFKNMEKH